MLASSVAYAQAGPFTSVATVYGSGDGGNCGYGTVETSTIPFGRIVAVGGDDWNLGQGCGRFIEIDTSAATCPGVGPCNFGAGPVIARVVDRCPECTDHHIDLSTIAWNAATNNGTPTLLSNVSWKWVYGDFPGNMQLEIRTGSSAFWLGVIPRDFNVGIQTLELRSSGSAVWQAMPQELNLGYFTWDQSILPLVAPLSIRVTDINGAVYVATDAVTAFSGTHDLGLQLAPPAVVPALFPVAALGLLGGGLAVGLRRFRTVSSSPGEEVPESRA